MFFSISIFFILLFIIINISYLILAFLSLMEIVKLNKNSYKKENKLTSNPCISILIPAYNEAFNIIQTIDSICRQEYKNYEIIIINDGSLDNTLEILKENYNLKATKSSFKKEFSTKNIRNYYVSDKIANLKVIDKDRGGKSDALNAGLNMSSHELFCSLDADTVLDKHSLKNIIKPFIENTNVVAVGGTIKILNGCKITNGNLHERNPSKNLLALPQSIEYVHSFIFGRFAWLKINCPLILSGAFTIFLKKPIIDIGGYKENTVGEDMEIVLRLHKKMLLNKLKYRILHSPNAIGWTEAPEEINILRNQRIRWHRGLGESLFSHKDIFLNNSLGMLGFLAYPFALFFQFFSPILQVSAYIYFFLFFSFGLIGLNEILLFILVSIFFGILISFLSAIIDQRMFKTWSKNNYLILFLGSVIENIGYRQLNLFWRCVAIFNLFFYSGYNWREMSRRGNNQNIG